MPPRPRDRSSSVSSPAPAFREVAIVGVTGGRAEVHTAAGERLVARLPQHVSAEWLAAAVLVAPVVAVVANMDAGEPFVWGIFPSPAHAAVRVPVTVRGTDIVFDASESVTLATASSSMSLRKAGELHMRGFDMMNRGARGAHGGRAKPS